MKKLFIFMAIIIFSNSNTYSQSINLQQARAMALASSSSLARFELSIRTSILNERSQLYAMLPQVSANVNASMYYFFDGEFVNPADTFTAGASFSVTQIIFQGGRNFIQRAIREIETERVRKNALAAFFDVLDAVDNAYYAVLEAAASLEAEQSSLEAASLGLAIAEIRYNGGMINQGDYLKALSDKEMRENSFNIARRNLSQVMNRFKVLTKITVNVQLEEISFDVYEDTLLRLASISDEDAEALYDDFWNLIASSNPSLAIAAMSNDIAGKNHTLTLRSYSPEVSATVFSATVPFVSSRNAETTRNATTRGGVTITGRIPLDFWVMNNNIEKSRIARDQADIDFENTQRDAEQELSGALSGLFTQAANVLSSRRSLEYAQRHFDFIMERYRLGHSSVSDLNEASSFLITARNNLNRASYSFLQGLSKLRSLCALDDEEALLNKLIRN